MSSPVQGELAGELLALHLPQHILKHSRGHLSVASLGAGGREDRYLLTADGESC